MAVSAGDTQSNRHHFVTADPSHVGEQQPCWTDVFDTIKVLYDVAIGRFKVWIIAFH